MKILKNLLALLVAVNILCLNPYKVFSGNFFAKNLEDVKKSIVSINTMPHANLHGVEKMGWRATGFIVESSRGLILTNKHVSGGFGLFNYEIYLYNGKKIEGRQIYYDKFCDIALLKVDPANLVGIPELKIASKDPSIGEKVLIVGNNDGSSFSCQDGLISDLSDISYPSSCQLIIANLNTRGGSSGSPILNKNFEVVGLNFAGNSTYALGIHRKYLYDLVKIFREDKIYKRKSIGCTFYHVNISDAIKYLGLPESFAKIYMKKYPKSNGRILSVSGSAIGFPAYGILGDRDLVLEVDGKLLGPDIVELDLVVDSCKEEVELTVLKNGKMEKVKFKPIFLDRSAKEFLEFCGFFFFESDETVAMRINKPVGTVLFSLNEENRSSFVSSISKNLEFPLSGIYCYELLSVDDKQINSLEDLKRMVPSLKNKKKFRIKYKSLVPVGSDSLFRAYELLGYSFAKSEVIADIDISKDQSITALYNLKDGLWNRLEL